MRQHLGDECRVRASHTKSRVRLTPGDKGVARMLPPPALVLKIKCTAQHSAKCTGQRWIRGE
jgi:hypothetical protein